MNRLVIGGTDKSHLLLRMMQEHFDRGFTLIDPDGSLAERLANLIPVRLTQRTMYLDPADFLHPVAFNILDQVPPDERDTLTLQICSYFEAMWPQGWGAQSDFILANCVRILLDTSGSTMLGVLKLLKDKSYRTACLLHCKNPVVLANWDAINAWEAKEYAKAVMPLQNKVGKLLLSTVMQNMLGQPHSLFVPKPGSIVIVNLNRAKVGDQTAFLLGSLVASRTTGPLYVSNYGFFGFPFSRGDFTVSLQFLRELQEKQRDAVLQFDEKYVFKTSRRDAEDLAFYVGVSNPSLLVDLAPNEYKVEGEEPTVPPAPRVGKRLRAIRKRTRACFTRRRGHAERQVREFLGARDGTAIQLS